MKVILLLTLFLISFYPSLFSYTKALDNEVEAIGLSYKIVSYYSKGKVDNAFEIMHPYITFDEKSYESLKNITSAKYPVIEENYGKSIGVRLLSVSCVSDFAIRIVLANLRELHIIKWEFIFYKNKDGWVLNNISWNDKITELFDTQNRNEP